LFFFARILTSTLVLISTSVAVAVGLTAEGTPPGFSEDAFRSSFEGSYFSTTGNYLSNASTSALLPGNSFTEIRGDVNLGYDFTDSFGMYGATVFKSNASQTGALNRNNTNFTDIIAGVGFLIWSGFVDVIPDFSVDVPLYTSPGADTSVALGNGALEASGLIHLTRHFKPLALSASVGYTYRTEGLSGLLPWSFNGYSSFKSFFVQLGLSGAVSINERITLFTETR
jgi:hypothetical protein